MSSQSLTPLKVFVALPKYLASTWTRIYVQVQCSVRTVLCRYRW